MTYPFTRVNEIRKLEISDLERIARFRRAGYGGSVSDSLDRCGVGQTDFSSQFKPLRPGIQLVGRAITVKLHSMPQYHLTPEEWEAREAKMDSEGGHPQKRMMSAIRESEPGSVLCYDCGGDMRAGHIGEMTCQLAYASGARGLLMAGNTRDSQYIAKMADFPVFSFGTRPTDGSRGMLITDVNVPIYVPGHQTHYVTVMPGDFIFGDADGVQLIPKNVVDEVLLQVEDIYEKENAERERLAAGDMAIDDVYRMFGVI